MSDDFESKNIMNEALHYYGLLRFDQALAKLDQMLASCPNDSEALYLRARCLFYLDRYDESFNDCNEALINGFSVSECNYLFGQIFIETNRHREAEKCLLEALRLNPQGADIMATYGFLMLKTGYEKKARKLIEEALRIDPSDQVALNYKFCYHVAKDKPKDQKEALERFFHNSGNEVMKLVQAGAMETNNGHYKAARENFRQALLLNPADETVLSSLREMEKLSSILYLPQRIIQKIGGPIVFMIGMIVTIMILSSLGAPEEVAVGILVTYLLLCVYSWIAPLLYKIIEKIRNR